MWWHLYHEINDSSGANIIKIYIDGTLIATGTANQQVDGWIQGWGRRTETKVPRDN